MNARPEDLLRLHHVEPVEDALHWRDEQPHAPCSRAQAGGWVSLLGEIQTRPLVYFERFEDVHNAIEREKRIKGWLRIKKIGLIVSVNPAWRDLSLEWYERHAFQPDAGHDLSATPNPAKLSS